MTTQIPNHAHCRVCQRAVQFGKESCSPECEKQLDDLKQRQQKTKRFYYITIAILVILFAVQLTQAF